MSFRLRLILAFAGLALMQALLFAALSDKLIREGLAGEAHTRLAQVSSLLPDDAPARDWPSSPVADPAAKAAWRQALADYATRFSLTRATLLLGRVSLDSAGSDIEAAGWWLAD